MSDDANNERNQKIADILLARHLYPLRPGNDETVWLHVLAAAASALAGLEITAQQVHFVINDTSFLVEWTPEEDKILLANDSNGYALDTHMADIGSTMTKQDCDIRLKFLQDQKRRSSELNTSESGFTRDQDAVLTFLRQRFTIGSKPQWRMIAPYANKTEHECRSRWQALHQDVRNARKSQRMATDTAYAKNRRETQKAYDKKRQLAKKATKDAEDSDSEDEGKLGAWKAMQAKETATKEFEKEAIIHWLDNNRVSEKDGRKLWSDAFSPNTKSSKKRSQRRRRRSRSASPPPARHLRLEPPRARSSSPWTGTRANFPEPGPGTGDNTSFAESIDALDDLDNLSDTSVPAGYDLPSSATTAALESPEQHGASGLGNGQFDGYHGHGTNNFAANGGNSLAVHGYPPQPPHSAGHHISTFSSGVAGNGMHHAGVHGGAAVGGMGNGFPQANTQQPPYYAGHHLNAFPPGVLGSGMPDAGVGGMGNGYHPAHPHQPPYSAQPNTFAPGLLGIGMPHAGVGGTGNGYHPAHPHQPPYYAGNQPNSFSPNVLGSGMLPTGGHGGAPTGGMSNGFHPSRPFDDNGNEKYNKYKYN